MRLLICLSIFQVLRLQIANQQNPIFFIRSSAFGAGATMTEMAHARRGERSTCDHHVTGQFFFCTRPAPVSSATPFALHCIIPL